MNNYRIFETDEYLNKLQRLDREQRRFIEAKLKKHIYPQLREQPYFGNNVRKLQGYHPETWRYRIGQFRLFYGIDEEERIVIILTIDYRKDAYR